MALSARSLMFAPMLLWGLVLCWSSVSFSAEMATPGGAAALVTEGATAVDTAAAAPEGVITLPSDYRVKETGDRLESVLAERGMTLFARIDHARGAAGVGAELRDTELLIFGNPKVGTPLMQCQQSVALDLPQKALIWQGAEGNVWISYNDPSYLQQRHQISGCGGVLAKVSGALSSMLKAAAQ